MKFIADKLRNWTPTFSPTAYKAVLVAMMAGAFAIPLAFVALPYVEFFNDMAVQPKGRAQSLYGWWFPEKSLVERSAVVGTIAQGYHPYPLEGNDDKTIKRAGQMFTNPLPRAMAVLERGRKVYNIYCYPCHSTMGLADGPVVGPNRFPAPTSLQTDVVRNYKDGEIFHIIARGKGKMPAYADRIAPEDRWAAIHYVRVLQRSMNPKPEDLK
jgi:hypothetical protein